MEPTMQPQLSPSEQPSKPRWPRKKVITLIVVGVLVLLGISILIGKLSDNGTPSDTDSSNVYYDRPGYDRSKLGNGIGDPLALKMDNTSQAVSHRGKAVIQACNLLPLSDLAENDFLLKANTLPSVVTRAYNDGVGKAAYGKVFGSSLTSFGLGLDVNNCSYVLEADALATVSISSFQPFTVPASVIQQEIEDSFTASGTVESMKSYTSKRQSAAKLPGETDRKEYLVVKPDKSGFLVSMKLPSGKEGKAQELLKTIAANFIQESKKPSAPAATSYDSPVFDKSFVPACNIITNADIRALSAQDASPLVLEGIASSVGVIEYGTSQDNTRKYNYISNECTRTTIGGGLALTGGGEARLKAATTSYLEDTPAKGQIEQNRHTNPNNKQNMPISGVGDEAVAYLSAVGDVHIIFRKGQIVVDVSIDKTTQRKLGTQGLSATTAKLTPIAQSIASRVTP